MNKEEALQYVKEVAREKVLTRDEVIGAYDGSSAGDVVLTRRIGIAEILYYIGGAVVFLGIGILVWQNWASLSFATRLLATLGSSIAAYAIGFVLSRGKKWEDVGTAFYFISALVLPMGLYVIFENAGLDMGTALVRALISGICFGIFLLSWFSFRKNLFLLFSIIFGTWFFFALTDLMVAGNPVFNTDFFSYRTFVVGLSYILMGYSFSREKRAPLSGFLYGFGILGLLGSAFTLGGWFPNGNGFWELIFPFLVFATLFVSVHLKSKSFLTFGSLFLMAYILKITSEYFTKGLGWPLSLVLAGLLLIAVGYLYVYLKRKYMIA